MSLVNPCYSFDINAATSKITQFERAALIKTDQLSVLVVYNAIIVRVIDMLQSIFTNTNFALKFFQEETITGPPTIKLTRISLQWIVAWYTI